MGSIPAKRCRGVGTPRPPVYNSRVVKIDAATDGTEQRLPLEGKLAQRQLRLMRSKLPIITIGWYDTVTFDLIRHAKRRDTFPSRGRLFFRLAGTSPEKSRSNTHLSLTFPVGKVTIDSVWCTRGLYNSLCFIFIRHLPVGFFAPHGVSLC